jgi:hypothetical protein
MSDELYKERTHITQTRTCNHCYEKNYKTVFDEEGNPTKEYYEKKTEVAINEIILYDDPNDFVTKVITGIKSQKSWDCPKCSKINRVRDSPTSDKRFGSNATHGVIYEQPIYSILNRSKFDHLSMNWVKNFLREVDSSMIAYQKAFFEERGTEMAEPIQHITEK